MQPKPNLAYQNTDQTQLDLFPKLDSRTWPKPTLITNTSLISTQMYCIRCLNIGYTLPRYGKPGYVPVMDMGLLLYLAWTVS